MKIDKQKLDDSLRRLDKMPDIGPNNENIYNAARTLSDILPHLEEMIEARSEFSERLGASNDDAEFIFAADCAPKMDEIINILEGKNNSN